MSARYIISSGVEFWPENHQLVVCGTQNLVITLHIPASRCLQLLIERRYSLILQRDFYSYVWGDEGASVSANTLYQNIALLRKALKSTGEGNKELVVTVYKKGFRLNDKFSVIEQRDDRKIEKKAVFNERQVVSNADKLISPAESVFENPTKFRKNVLVAIIMILVIVLGMQNYNWGYASIPSSVSKFVRGSAGSGCVLFAEMDANNMIGKLKSRSAVNIDCQRAPYVYVNSSVHKARTSFLACEREINHVRSLECLTRNAFEGDK